MKFEWQPPRIGAKQEGEVSCWAFGIRHPLKYTVMDKLAQNIAKLDGLVGVYPQIPFGTLVIFHTKNDAIRGANDMKAQGYPVGGVTEVYVKEEYVNGERRNK